MPAKQGVKQVAKTIEVSTVYDEKGKPFQTLMEELLKTMLQK